MLDRVQEKISPDGASLGILGTAAAKHDTYLPIHPDRLVSAQSQNDPKTLATLLMEFF